MHLVGPPVLRAAVRYRAVRRSRRASCSMPITPSSHSCQFLVASTKLIRAIPRLRFMAEDTCDGYQREPHQAKIVVELLRPDNTKIHYCDVCYTRWQLSDEEFP